MLTLPNGAPGGGLGWGFSPPGGGASTDYSHGKTVYTEKGAAQGMWGAPAGDGRGSAAVRDSGYSGGNEQGGGYAAMQQQSMRPVSSEESYGARPSSAEWPGVFSSQFFSSMALDGSVEGWEAPSGNLAHAQNSPNVDDEDNDDDIESFSMIGRMLEEFEGSESPMGQSEKKGGMLYYDLPKPGADSSASRQSTIEQLAGVPSMLASGVPATLDAHGEHSFGEHPSRTLFVRNISSSWADEELRATFVQYGDVRSLYTACKHRGFVMISYFDIRAARNAMRQLQGKTVQGLQLDIHFSIPKECPTDKDLNQGTLVVFNLDNSVSGEELKVGSSFLGYFSG
mmetsp:Transcript_5258/g.17413  ORF Transcript_5258/g.17413 Transcript_5258/m.17413 type:complete len:340 (-) Transcript_5258:374-1393(-)